MGSASHLSLCAQRLLQTPAPSQNVGVCPEQMLGGSGWDGLLRLYASVQRVRSLEFLDD